jgi:uncharacterized protein
MNQKFSLSKYVKRFDGGSYTSLFHGLTLKKAYGRTEAIDKALKEIEESDALQNNGVIRTLIENGFVVEDGKDETRFSDIKGQLGKSNVSNIVMLVSNNCNYACKYCQIEENMEHEQKIFNMSIDDAKKALDLFEKNSKKENKKTISITGGEPLINIETVKYILERAENMPNTRVIIFTNGSLVTEELADYFSKTDTLMLVSLDGTKEINDSVRIQKGGSGTFDLALRGYKLLKEAGCKTGISAVTGTHNVDRMNEVLDLFSELTPPSIGLNFGHHLLGKENPTALPMGKFAEILTDFYKKMREKKIFVENISRFITPFYQEKPRLNECQAQGRGFSVDSRGKVGVCKSLLVSDVISMKIDDISEDISKEPVFQEWAERSPFTLKECKECNVIGVCGGGCTYDSFAINNGDIKKIDPRVCEYTNKVLEFLIWDLFENIKDKLGDEIYVPSVEEQEQTFLKFYDPKNELQRSVGHEKDR